MCERETPPDRPPVTSKEIALQLNISAKKVEAHVSSLLRKLQLSNRHALSHWAVERRLVN